jgi:hypothetical protein
MAYEIPQQLEYKEKIMFGLTFKQLAYLFLFAPLGTYLYFKTDLSFPVKIFFLINISALAIGFIFLNLDYYLKAWIGWLKYRKITKPHKLSNFVGVNPKKFKYVLL